MGAYNFSLGAGAASGAAIATIATMLGHGYTAAILACALAPIGALPLVLFSQNSKKRAGLEDETAEGAPKNVPTSVA